MQLQIFILSWLFFCSSLLYSEKAAVVLGVDRIFSEPEAMQLLNGKKVGLITNQTGVSSHLESTIQLMLQSQKRANCTLVALFAPEHGLYGDIYADQKVVSSKTKEGVPIFSLYGATRRPTSDMLKGITLLVFDIQDVGSRPYTYVTTLFYVMEEAAKRHIPVVVLDRPNPINGLVVDGPMLEKEFRSFIGYVEIPFCHGMTVGELACLFNDLQAIKCDLKVVRMKGWKRHMSFEETGLHWIPTSPNIPDSKTALAYPMTGILGDMGLVSIGIGYTLPFRVVGAPWIDDVTFARKMNGFGLKGVSFIPIRFRPFSGRFQKMDCRGCLLIVTDPKKYLPVTCQYALLSAIRELYPKETKEALVALEKKPSTFFLACGTKSIFEMVKKLDCPFEALCQLHTKSKEQFLGMRKKYLFTEYQ